jgi:hypothetical protein
MDIQKIIINQNITDISFKEEWQNRNLVIYAGGLGKVRDLIGLLPEIKKLNLKFFLDGAKEESYEAVQILSSLGVYSGIVINENADWEKLTDLMLYALCGRVAHAPIEPFQYVFDMYERNRLVDYGVVYETEKGEGRKEKAEGKYPSVIPNAVRNLNVNGMQNGWQRFFYEPTPCAACAGWRICTGKYENLKDKTGCQNFTNEWLNMIENLRFKDLINH